MFSILCELNDARLKNLTFMCWITYIDFSDGNQKVKAILSSSHNCNLDQAASKTNFDEAWDF